MFTNTKQHAIISMALGVEENISIISCMILNHRNEEYSYNNPVKLKLTGKLLQQV